MFTDSHCHLGDPQYLPDFAAVMQRAAEAQVNCIIAIGAGDGMEGNQRACDLTKQYENVFAAIGIHPHDAGTVPENYLQILKTFLTPKIISIGEIGLDYHYDHAPRDVQQQRFREQLKLAQELSLPVIIHSRDAWEESVRIISENKPKRCGVFHCFGGSLVEAQQAIDLGFYISVSGIVTFGKKVESLVAVVREVPLEKILIETDAPWLAPMPNRGKRNEPAWVVRVAEKIAGIKGISVEEVGITTTKNAKTLFGIL